MAEGKMTVREVGLLEGITGLGQSVVGEVRTSLYVLRLVDEFVDTCIHSRRLAEHQRERAKLLTEHVRAFAGTIESEEEVCELFLEAEHDLEILAECMISIAKRLEIELVVESTDDDAAIACREAINADLALRGALQTLRWEIMEHNADLEEGTGKTFGTVEELIADLRKPD